MKREHLKFKTRKLGFVFEGENLFPCYKSVKNKSHLLKFEDLRISPLENNNASENHKFL
jgi:ABC-type molybdate transport system ATPase subunit